MLQTEYLAVKEITLHLLQHCFCGIIVGQRQEKKDQAVWQKTITGVPPSQIQRYGLNKQAFSKQKILKGLRMLECGILILTRTLEPVKRLLLRS